MDIRKFLSTQYQTHCTKMFSRRLAQLMVVSEQEGAEIFLDGISTGRFTPAMLDVREGSEVTLTLQLMAHDIYTRKLSIGAPLTFHYCVLQRQAWKVYEDDDSSWAYLPGQTAAKTIKGVEVRSL